MPRLPRRSILEERHALALEDPVADADTNPLTALSDALADAVEIAGRSIVTVAARRRLPATGIAWEAAGVVVTADHVLEREDDITVVLPGGGEVKATIAGRDPGSDLAVLRLADTTLVPIERGPAVRPGHLVLALGRAGEGLPMASFGVVSAVGGQWRTFTGGTVAGFVRSDTTFYPGFSGGPLVDGRGRAAGINSSRLGRGGGLTIPIAAAETIVESLLRQGRLKRGYLGIGSQPTALPASLVAKANGQETGLLIVGVEPGSPADAAGLLVGDILLRLGDISATATEMLQSALGPESVGQPLAIAVLRGGEPTIVTVTVGERE